MNYKTDVVIIGAGPVGLFAVFELGLLNLKTHVIDNLDKIGGQCIELYPEKPIFDIPSRLKITGKELVDDLIEQAKTFDPVFHLNQQADSIKKISDGNWKITTSTNNEIICKCIVIAAGAGSFVPRKPPIENILDYENKSVYYSIKDKSEFKNKKILICGGGDSALDWTIELSEYSDVTLLHRRDDFRASPDSVNKMRNLFNEGKIDFKIGNITKLIGEDGFIKKVQCEKDQKNFFIETNYILPFYGLKMELGPIADWGLNLDQNLIRVDTEKFETSEPSIFAIGDINFYPGKLKLILSGFHEAALMAQKCFQYCNPEKKLVFRYSTSSKELREKIK
tara:strand:- start:68 stop:1078 length:1011 start_codon:yes stop_codon:yes gene_type:complete